MAAGRAFRLKNDNVANIPPPEHPSDPLTGQYVRQGSKLTGPCTLLLVTRSTTTHAKATSYVLRVHPDGKRSYVSSLWERPSAGTYALEYRHQRYVMTLTDTNAVVQRDGEGSPLYINRASGNSIAAS